MGKLAAKLADAGYNVEVEALATTRERSLQGVQLRYVQMRVDREMARYVPQSVHDRGYKDLPRSVDRLHRDARVQSISIIRDHDHETIAKTTYKDGQLQGKHGQPTPGQKLREERERERTPAERRTFANGEAGLKEGRKILAERQLANETHSGMRSEVEAPPGRGKRTLAGPDHAKQHTPPTRTRAREECTGRDLSR